MRRFHKSLFLFFFMFCFLLSHGQQLYPSKWTFSVEKNSETEATLIFKVALDQGWHIYSQHTPDGGPLPTVFTFTKASCYQPDGKVSEPKPHEEFDETFGVKVLQFSDEVIFKQ